ncbi:gliotoxin thiomethyltransferase [Aspergillus vadensis CBS 113365]|uniref:S-adenosyl-L-methionine-dependent methyltransferase n=1 Tax=Aspergillus vadensis (strain CBS 113365 / IMI 142717 / IBT 24658) TaxID=1448311 RepID=A0A319BMP7_ASPVC|nr:S-adenosyl-L-methionine-dependent methyltransferase [Aspergillus vadensis CBS 113365]PYH74586.1 S-adenosyl-L-methionine-dependent methyltransferase [Aspergillus vadensis CBS 113365]
MPPKISPSSYLTPAFVSRYHLAEKLTGVFVAPLVQHSGILSTPSDNNKKQPLVVFDNACGLGVVSSYLNSTLPEEVKRHWTLTCGDVTELMVEYTKLRSEKEGWVNAEAKVVDAQWTGLDGDRYTHVLSAFAFMMIPNARAAMRECFRILQSGGVLATSTWRTSSWLVIMKEAIEATPWNVKFPTMKEFLALHNEGWDDETFVKARFEEEGFEDVEVTSVQRETSLTVSEFMEVGEGMIPIVTGAFWTPEQREMYEAKAPLVIREYLEEKFGADGVVKMDPVAVLAVGRKP